MALRSRVPLLGNRFREEGATALGKAIKMNSTHTELELATKFARLRRPRLLNR